MKRLLVLLFIITCFASKAQDGRYLKLDGVDSNVSLGMDTLNCNWSVEAWVRGDDTTWKESEVIIGGGYYSDINIVDKLPVVLKNGKLHNTYSGATSAQVLDDKWHHIAVTCGSTTGTTLYINGKNVAHSDKVSSIVPGVVGADQTKESVFGGDIDELRIWRCELSESSINEWMNRPLTSSHPKFKHLKGYYPFDEQSSDVYLNWAANGPISFHARNDRMDYYGSSNITPTESCDNEEFAAKRSKKELFNAVEIASEWDSPQGSLDQQIIKLRIAISGSKGASELTDMVLDISQTTDLTDIDNISLYYTGSEPKSSVKERLASFKPQNRTHLNLSYNLNSGINYFLVTFDVSKSAKWSNRLAATVESFSINGKRHTPLKSNDYYAKQITPASDDKSVVRVLQWNIWHGGVHMGSDGRAYIIDLIKAVDADIITLQEGYGAQDRIAKALGFNLQTKSSKDNLALLSRYPITKIATKNSFQSNPAFITLPSGERVYINDCWLRYAYNPEYTCCYGSQGLDTDIWIKEDIERPTFDMQKIFNEDLYPYVNDSMVQLISGDFNSCSHLDWTHRTKHLHYGYGDVDFPTSQLMYDNGFVDSYRVVNPDEVTHQGSTYSVIYGQLQNSRIDFIYHKGDIRPLYSKIIRTSEEIDSVWASDHAAVYVIFEL